MRNLGTGVVNLLGTTGGTTKVAKHTHEVGGNTEYLYGARVVTDAVNYGTLNTASDDNNKILKATLSESVEGVSIPFSKNTRLTSATVAGGPGTYTVMSLDPTKIQINEVNPLITEQIPPFQYVYIYKRVAKKT